MAASIMTLSSASASASIKAFATNVEAAEITPATVTIDRKPEVTWTAGFVVDSAVADHVMSRTYALAGGIADNVDIDLSSAWVNAFGDAVALLRIKSILIENVSLVDNTDCELRVGNSGGNEFISWCSGAGDYVRVFHGGFFALSAPGDADNDGYAVGAGGSDLLRIENAGGDAAIVIVTIIGITGV